MTVAATSGYAPAARPLAASSVERLRAALLWLTGLAGAFVFIEPSPYEMVSLLTMIVFAVTGLTLSVAVMPLALLLILYNIGFGIAVIPVIAVEKTLSWVLISVYLSLTAVFFAAMLGDNTRARLDWLMRGYTAAAVVASLASIAGYFHLAGGLSEMFLRYGRAQGTFNDPNVLGAFLVLPALLAFQRILAGRTGEALRSAALFLLFVSALLLSFSRAAWGQLAFGGLLLMAFTFITSRSTNERLRIVMIALLGTIFLAAFIAALLSIDKVAELFQTRASLDQSYDEGPTGRFGRHVLGMILSLDHPFGIGPLQFHHIFPEDPHNAFLNAFMSGGWLSGFAYLTFTAVTLAAGFRAIFFATPWRPIYIAVYCAFVCVVGESFIIDSDHWRHYLLLLGVTWGLMAASRRAALARPRAAA